jgi:hypothetical protein
LGFIANLVIVFPPLPRQWRRMVVFVVHWILSAKWFFSPVFFFSTIFWFTHFYWLLFCLFSHCLISSVLLVSFFLFPCRIGLHLANFQVMSVHRWLWLGCLYGGYLYGTEKSDTIPWTCPCCTRSLRPVEMYGHLCMIWVILVWCISSTS